MDKVEELEQRIVMLEWVVETTRNELWAFKAERRKEQMEELRALSNKPWYCWLWKKGN